MLFKALCSYKNSVAFLSKHKKLKRLNHSNTSKNVSSFISTQFSQELEVVMLFTCTFGTEVVFSDTNFKISRVKSYLF